MRRTESPLTATPLQTKLLRLVCGIALALFVVPALLGMALGGVLVAGISQERDQLDALAREALQAVGLGKYSTYTQFQVGSGAVAFHTSQYYSHTDHTDLRAALLSDAATTEGWTVEPVTAVEYAAQIPPEMAFLLPEDGLVFDASYHRDNTRAFFDQESGLMVYVPPATAPEPITFNRGGLTIPTDGWVYRMDTCILGDGEIFWAFVVPEEDRPALEATLSTHADWNEDWHRGSIPQGEYVRLFEAITPPLTALYPAAEVVFDRWHYANYDSNDVSYYRYANFFPAVMQEIGAGRTLEWEVGFYDEDTGLFIWYESSC